jgi:putative flippase GtrA
MLVGMTAVATLPSPAAVAAAPAAPVLDVVVPVYNEQTDLEPCLRRLHHHLTTALPYPFRITVADNASTDATLTVAHRLAGELPGVHVLHLDAKGRGRALRAAWTASPAPVLAYLDVDLSTDLAGLLPLIAPLISGHSDLAIGTRLAGTARVVRGPKREILSRGYNLLLRGLLAARFTDAQCGFKAIRADVATDLLPLVQDNDWFFDTELLILAQHAGLRIHEVPVDWVDDPDSRVDLTATVWADLKGIARLGRALATRTLPLAALRTQHGRHPLQPARLASQLVRFTAVGLASTAAYLLLYLMLRGVLGAQPANLGALLLTTVGNTAANRRYTFAITDHRDRTRQHLQALLAFAAALALTSSSLAALHAVVVTPGRFAEIAVLVVANLAGTVLRFLLLRNWVFRAAR